MVSLRLKWTQLVFLPNAIHLSRPTNQYEYERERNTRKQEEDRGILKNCQDLNSILLKNK